MLNAADTLIDGTKMNLGGHELVIPALNFKQLKELKPELMKFQQGAGDDFSEEQLEAYLTVVHAAVSRNYPDATRGDVEELIDLKTVPLVIAAVMGQQIGTA